MKLDREHFKAQGMYAAHLRNRMDWPYLNCEVPVYGLGTSWQAKAFREGFEEQLAKLYSRGVARRAHAVALYEEARKSAQADNMPRATRCFRKMREMLDREFAPAIATRR
jgi:hypothetical protein